MKEPDELKQIRKIISDNKRHISFRLAITWVVTLTISIAALNLVVQKPSNATEYCIISKQEKKQLDDKITYIVASDRISKMRIYKLMKRKFGYPTISKMPCHQFEDALKYLAEIEKETVF